MGFKFRRFRAKLNWKTKTTTPQVVCLRYHIQSEFSELSPPASLQELVEEKNSTHEHIKAKYEHSTYTLEAPIINNVGVNNIAQKPKDEIKQEIVSNSVKTDTTDDDIIESTSPVRSILKKISVDNTELTSNNDESAHHDAFSSNNKKSTLIFMTENHDENTEKKNEQITMNAEYMRNKYKETKASYASDNLTDAKQVNWRETVEVIPATTRESESDFKVHVSESTEVVAEHSSHESDNEEDDDEDDIEHESYPGNRMTYSSQAESIFFGSEEPKPSAKARNNSNRITSA